MDIKEDANDHLKDVEIEDFSSLLYETLAPRVLFGDVQERLVLSKPYLDVSRAVLMLSYIYRPLFREKFEGQLNILESHEGNPSLFAYAFGDLLNKHHSGYNFLIFCAFISEMYIFLGERQTADKEYYYIDKCETTLNEIVANFEGNEKRWANIFLMGSKISRKFTLLEPLMNEVPKCTAFQGATAAQDIVNETVRNQLQIFPNQGNFQQMSRNAHCKVIWSSRPECFPGTSFKLNGIGPPPLYHFKVGKITYRDSDNLALRISTREMNLDTPVIYQNENQAASNQVATANVADLSETVTTKQQVFVTHGKSQQMNMSGNFSKPNSPTVAAFFGHQLVPETSPQVNAHTTQQFLNAPNNSLDIRSSTCETNSVNQTVHETEKHATSQGTTANEVNDTGPNQSQLYATHISFQLTTRDDNLSRRNFESVGGSYESNPEIFPGNSLPADTPHFQLQYEAEARAERNFLPQIQDGLATRSSTSATNSVNQTTHASERHESEIWWADLSSIHNKLFNDDL